MKSLKNAWLRLFFSMFGLVLSVAVLAQDQTGGGSSSSTSSSTKTTSGSLGSGGNAWYTQPWIWIVGAAVFILLLVALLNGNKGRDTVVTKRTVIREGES